KDYDTKIKNFKGDEAVKKELDEAKLKLDDALQKYADYDTLKEQAGKADESKQELSVLNLEVSFNIVKPPFPDTVNKWESKGIWKEFKAKTTDKNIIKMIDGVPMAIDKENQYKSVKLEELVAKDEAIQKLLEGRKQKGTGAKEVELQDIKDVPFPVPTNATGKERSILIQEHLAKTGIGAMHDDYSKKFAELNDKILQGKKLEVA
ncbi:MAG: hypothetical protein ACUZ8H_00785, partial [Candidatus Anammoxibacter sp.]